VDILLDMGVDPKKSEEGVWIDLSDKTGYHAIEEAEIGAKAAIKIGRAYNLAQKKKLAKSLSTNRKLRDRDVDVEVNARVEGESMVGTVLLDWKNFKADGADFPFSKENVVAIWTQPQFVRFKDILQTLIVDEELFRMHTEEAALKN
jgi:hypothetical protein